MKLYTEEQVWQMYNLYDTNLDQDGCCIIDEYKHFDQCIKTLIPIEIPSDDIIKIAANGNIDGYNGAMWLKYNYIIKKKS